MQALLGRDVTKQRKRKPSGPPTAAADWRVMPSPSPAPTSTAAAAASSSIHDGPTATAAAAAAAARSHAAIPSTQAGPSNTPVEQECVRCPLCNIQLPHDHDKVNAHIGEWSRGLHAAPAFAAHVAFIGRLLPSFAGCCRLPRRQVPVQGLAEDSHPAGHHRPVCVAVRHRSAAAPQEAAAAGAAAGRRLAAFHQEAAKHGSGVGRGCRCGLNPWHGPLGGCGSDWGQ